MLIRPCSFVSENWFSKTAQRRRGGRARALIPRVLRMGDWASGLAAGGARAAMSSRFEGGSGVKAGAQKRERV